MKVGETVFPDLPDSFFDDFTDRRAERRAVTLCVQAALDGKACAARSKVNLPAA